MKMHFKPGFIAFSAAAFALATASLTATAEDHDDNLLEVTKIGVKLGHQAEFREGVKAYRDCYVEQDGSGSWSFWSSVDGDQMVYHVVSELDNWAEMDSGDEASRTCWTNIEEQVAPHMTSVSTMFARRMADWSGRAEGYNVVRLHQFRVDDEELFGETVGAITSILKEAEYEHLGTWYDVIGADSNEPGYFVVAHYDNFAAMDEERAGPYNTVVEHAGQERADELWGQFDDALHDDWEYFSEILRRDVDLSHSGED